MFQFCWEYKNCGIPCQVRDASALFCWRIVQESAPEISSSCFTCEYRAKWLNHEYSVIDFVQSSERRVAPRTGKKVLVVDDEPNILFALEESVGVEGYECLSAADGEEGLFLAREILPNLIISDVMMPKMNGYELCAALKSDERTSHIPVMLVTVRGLTSDREEGTRVGADAYIVKPFQAQNLFETIETLISRDG